METLPFQQMYRDHISPCMCMGIRVLSSTLYCCLVAKSCLTLCACQDPVHGISEARIWEWVVISSSSGSSQPGDWTLAGGFFTAEPSGKPLLHPLERNKCCPIHYTRLQKTLVLDLPCHFLIYKIISKSLFYFPENKLRHYNGSERKVTTKIISSRRDLLDLVFSFSFVQDHICIIPNR